MRLAARVGGVGLLIGLLAFLDIVVMRVSMRLAARVGGVGLRIGLVYVAQNVGRTGLPSKAEPSWEILAAEGAFRPTTIVISVRNCKLAYMFNHVFATLLSAAAGAGTTIRRRSTACRGTRNTCCSECAVGRHPSGKLCRWGGYQAASRGRRRRRAVGSPGGEESPTPGSAAVTT